MEQQQKHKRRLQTFSNWQLQQEADTHHVCKPGYGSPRGLHSVGASRLPQTAPGPHVPHPAQTDVVSFCKIFYNVLELPGNYIVYITWDQHAQVNKADLVLVRLWPCIRNCLSVIVCGIQKPFESAHLLTLSSVNMH